MLKKQKGFTLIEAMIAMAMLTIVLIIIFIAFTIGLRTFVSEKSQSDVTFEINRGISSLKRDLRGILEIVSAESTSITFWYKDLNGNSTREANETMIYFWSGTPGDSLIRALGSDSRPVANYVHSFELSYDIPGDIKVVNVKLVIRKESIINTAESSVSLRNL